MIGGVRTELEDRVVQPAPIDLLVVGALSDETSDVLDHAVAVAIEVRELDEPVVRSSGVDLREGRASHLAPLGEFA